MPEVGNELDEAIRAWKDINLFSMAHRTILESTGVDIGTCAKCGVWLELTTVGASHMVVPDCKKVLRKGLKSIVAEIEAEQAKLKYAEVGFLGKWCFFQAAKLALQGIMTPAQR